MTHIFNKPGQCRNIKYMADDTPGAYIPPTEI